MPAGPRFVLSEFSVFTYTKLENSDLENWNFSKSKDIWIGGRNLRLEV